jgi:hypothetical protein
MESSSVNGAPADASSQAVADADLSTDALLERLQGDRAWLLQQIDRGRWPDLRLDLAALERELGQLLEQAQRQREER